ncbi:F0F1 ATP synthase subunit delta [Helicobacter cetorum]|uniref:F0F1 ATP synthase subunit delta n=1 Tax=Helicobacter cetorum TaxID=138563 RepID=UPI000CF1961A|nr:F0F1 ATP synthase subunit delta [Helicobacter cetorum]
MEELRTISRHYAKAIKNYTKDNLDLLGEILAFLKELQEILKDSKLAKILLNSYTPLAVKRDILMAITEKITASKALVIVKPLLELMLKHNRLKALSVLAEEMSPYLERVKTLEATLFVQGELSQDKLVAMQQKLEKRFQSPVQIKQESLNENGVRLSVPSLGVEMGFSKKSVLERLEKQVIQSI